MDLWELVETLATLCVTALGVLWGGKFLWHKIRGTAPNPEASIANVEQQLTATERMQRLLASFEQDKAFPDGLAYESPLKVLTLDYSLDSLESLDHLLKQIRKAAKPNYQDFLDHANKKNFMLLCAAYLSTTIARAAGMEIKWYDYDEALHELKLVDFAPRYETSVSCMIDGQLHLPLDVISEMLFHPNPTLTCQISAERFLANAQPIRSIPESSILMARHRLTLDQDQQDALSAVGKLAAHALYQVKGREAIAPQLLVPDGDELQFQSFESADGLERGMKELGQAVAGQPYQVLAYDGFINLPTGRLDAINLKLKSYGANPIQLTISVPYRQATQPHGFSIHRPKLVESSLSEEDHPSLFKAFYSGVKSYDLPDNFWMLHLDEAV